MRDSIHVVRTAATFPILDSFGVLAGGGGGEGSEQTRFVELLRGFRTIFELRETIQVYTTNFEEPWDANCVKRLGAF